MLSRNAQKLEESKRTLEAHTENVETREKLIATSKTDLQKIEAFIINHEREGRDTERNREDAQRAFTEIEKKYKAAEDALKRAVKGERDNKSHPTYLQYQHKKDETIKNIASYEQELRYQTSQVERAASNVRMYEKTLQEETNELMRRAKQDVANDNRKPTNFRNAANDNKKPGSYREAA